VHSVDGRRDIDHQLLGKARPDLQKLLEDLHVLILDVSVVVLYRFIHHLGENCGFELDAFSLLSERLELAQILGLVRDELI